MTNPNEHTMEQLAETMAETEELWQVICSQVDDDRVEMLIDAMMQQHGLVMEGETNANAIMALIGFISHQIMNLHEEGDIAIESAMVLIQIGMQRGVNANMHVRSQDSVS